MADLRENLIHALLSKLLVESAIQGARMQTPVVGLGLVWAEFARAPKPLFILGVDDVWEAKGESTGDVVGAFVEVYL